MASLRDAVVAVVATAALVWFGTGLEPCWVLAWAAPLPVLLYAAGATAWRAAGVAVIAWAVGQIGMWPYLHGELRLPGAAIAAFVGAPSVAFGAAVLLYRALVRRGAGRMAVIGFAAARVTFEAVVAIVGPHGTAGSLAYSQVECLPVLQLASVTGLWGVVFAVSAVPAAVAAAWRLRRIGLAGGAVVGLVAVVAFGVVRLGGEVGPVVRVGLVASDPPTSPQQAKPGATKALLEAYAKASELRAQVIVWPEKIGEVGEPVDAVVQAVAERRGAVVVVGVVRDNYNEARVYAPGAAVRAYHKHHMLPPWEPFEVGTELVVIPQAGGAWGVQICKDLDFPALSRAYGEAGVGVMLAPAWDFDLDGAWHARMAVMRGVESGFGLVRAAKRGRLTVSDSRGRIVAEAASNAAPFSTLVADVPSRHEATLYGELGDWFAWLAAVALVAAVIRLIRQG